MTLVLAVVAAGVFGLLVLFGSGLRGVRIGFGGGVFWDLGWMFAGVAWVSETLVFLVFAWGFVGVVGVLVVLALVSKGFRGVSAAGRRVVAVAVPVVGYPLVVVLLPFILGCAMWLLFWVLTSFGTCIPPECQATPAVP
ncbi:hypothetical protein [Umezawaea tangerina]|nr:hypothetical protein [Umezawaea tangerina]